MNERFRPIDPYAKLTPDQKLAEARPRLKLYRRPQLFAEILLASGAFDDKPEMKSSLDFLVGQWMAATNSEEEVARKLVAPAKLATGAYITNRKVEEAAIKDGAEYLEEVFGFDEQKAEKLSRIFVRWHINNTKRVQKGMGVQEKPLYNPLCIKKPQARKCTILYGPTRREKVAC